MGGAKHGPTTNAPCCSCVIPLYDLIVSNLQAAFPPTSHLTASTVMSHRACQDGACGFLAGNANVEVCEVCRRVDYEEVRGRSRSGSCLSVQWKARERRCVGPIGPAKQYRCYLFQDLSSGVGVVRLTVLFGTRCQQPIFEVALGRSNHPAEDIYGAYIAPKEPHEDLLILQPHLTTTRIKTTTHAILEIKY